MTLFATIRAQNLQARKDKSPLAGLYATLIGELEKEEKNTGAATTDATAIATIQKFLKNSQETSKALQQRGRDTDPAFEKATQEQKALMGLLPTQMTPAEIQTALETIKNQGADKMGPALAALGKAHPGCYDRKLAADIAKSLYA